MFIFGNFKCYFLTLHPKQHLCTKFHVKNFSRIGNNSESLKVLSLSSKVKDFFKIQYSVMSFHVNSSKKKNVTLMSWILFIFIPYVQFSMNNKTLKFCEVILNRFQDIVFLNIF
ncbi:unnamed protein product [Meganyctiphanes norvegica]|uniref:Uncharacterized protein n=1 Tax=Meganyctiphanes norvegica TaxID=48144 RepID=A0AAV2QIF4_MEGNR